MQYSLLLILLPVALGQIKPDVQFDDENDRFDVSQQVRQGAFDQWDDFVAARRRSQKNNGRSFDARSLMNELKRRLHKEESKHNSYQHLDEKFQDRTEDKGNLISYLHGEARSGDPKIRRSGALVDKEVLLHNAVPLKLKIEGILVAVDDE